MRKKLAGRGGGGLKSCLHIRQIGESLTSWWSFRDSVINAQYSCSSHKPVSEAPGSTSGALSWLTMHGTAPFMFGTCEGCPHWVQHLCFPRAFLVCNIPGSGRVPWSSFCVYKHRHFPRHTPHCWRRELPASPHDGFFPLKPSQSWHLLPGPWRLPTAVLTEVRL